MSRYGFKINRNGGDQDSSDRVDWLDAFARKIEEASQSPLNAVEQARARDHRSLLDQITHIVSKQPRHSNVESKVQEYQDKTGLREYLRRMSASNEVKKTAEEMTGELPESFQSLPAQTVEDIKNFIRNKCETHHGNIQVPALIEDVSRTFRQAGLQPQDVNDMRFEKFVSDEIANAKKRSPSTDEHNANIGLGVGVDNNDIDSSNLDVFEGLTPAKT